jgi:hypothetical protein
VGIVLASVLVCMFCCYGCYRRQTVIVQTKQSVTVMSPIYPGTQSQFVPPAVTTKRIPVATSHQSNNGLSPEELSVLRDLKRRKGGHDDLTDTEMAYFHSNPNYARQIIAQAYLSQQSSKTISPVELNSPAESSAPTSPTAAVQPVQAVTKDDIKRLRLEKAIREERYTDAEIIMDAEEQPQFNDL